MRPWVRALLICCLVSVIAGYLVGEWQRKERQYAAWQRDQKVRAALSQHVRLIFPDGDHCTLLQAVELLRQQLDVPIDVEWRLEDTKLSPGHLISAKVPLQGVFEGPLDEVLEDMLFGADSVELGYQLEEGRIVFRQKPRSQAYAGILIREYETPAWSAGQVTLDEQAITELTATCINPDEWADVGGPYSAIPSPGAVSVAASNQIHRKIGRMLRQLEVLQSEPRSFQPVEFLEFGYPYDSSSPPAKILAALDRTGDFDYSEVSLLEFLGSISKRFDIPIIVEPERLKEAGISLKTPGLTYQASGVTLRSAMRNALSEYSLTYVLQPRGMVIKTPEDAGSHLISRLYPVQDLFEEHSPYNSREFVKVIAACVEPDAWEDVGGSGSLEMISRGWLLVWQTQEGHEHLLEFLNRLRHDVPRAARPRPALTSREETTRRIQTLLCGPQIIDSGPPAPLAAFAKSLQERLGVTVVLLSKHLEEINIGPESVNICLDPQPQPLWRQLDAALHLHGMAFVVRDEQILITSEEDAGGRLELEIVDTRDLTVWGGRFVSEECLMDLIRQSVGLQSWDDQGGPASMSKFKDCLLLFHDNPSRFKIREFLSWLRVHRHELPTPAEIARLDKNGSAYRRLIDQSQTTSDHWQAAYFRLLLCPEKPVDMPKAPLVPKRGFAGGMF